MSIITALKSVIKLNNNFNNGSLPASRASILEEKKKKEEDNPQSGSHFLLIVFPTTSDRLPKLLAFPFFFSSFV